MGFPDPSNTRPSMSRETGVFSTCSAQSGRLSIASTAAQAYSQRSPAEPRGICLCKTHVSCELQRGSRVVNARGALKHLQAHSSSVVVIPLRARCACWRSFWAQSSSRAGYVEGNAQATCRLRTATAANTCWLPHLHHRPRAIHLQHLPSPEGAISQPQVDNLSIFGGLQRGHTRIGCRCMSPANGCQQEHSRVCCR